MLCRHAAASPWLCHILQVLEELLCEQDELPHPWYLLALAYYGGGSYSEASETLQHGSKLLDGLAGEALDDAQALYSELSERIQEALQVSKQKAAEQ